MNNSGFRSAFDPFTNTTPQFFGENRGNLALDPEKADTREIGVVLSPSFIGGLTVSVDYWHIKLKDAIGQAGDNDILAYCFQGRTEFCAAITRDASGVVSKLTQQPFNLAAQQKAGIDVEGSYNLPVDRLFSGAGGDLTLRSQWTFYTKSTIDEGLGAGPFSTRGNVGAGTAGSLVLGPPRWRQTTTLAYGVDALRTSLTFRAQSAGVIDSRYIECQTGCPVSGAIAKTIEDNTVPSSFYIDASVAYTWEVGESEVETFLNVRNLLNTDPGIVPQGPTNFTYVFPLSRPHGGYDLLGRVMRAGVRFKM